MTTVLRRDKLNLRLVTSYQSIKCIFSTISARLSAVFWSFEIGEDCKFYGRTLFRKSPTSNIVIGDNCVFRSAQWSNLAGLNRACMISTLKPGAEILIGDRCGLSGTVIGSALSIHLGDDVLCGANVTITDTDWHGIAPNKRRKPGDKARVRIGNNVWLGMNVTVLKGVSIGDDAIIAAGSIVTKDIPPNVIAAGCPARVVKKLSNESSDDNKEILKT